MEQQSKKAGLDQMRGVLADFDWEGTSLDERLHELLSDAVAAFLEEAGLNPDDVSDGEMDELYNAVVESFMGSQGFVPRSG